MSAALGVMMLGLLVNVVTAEPVCGTSTTTRFKRYEGKDPVCFVMDGSKMLFYPEVDELSLLEAAGSYTRASADEDIQFEVGGIASDTISYRSDGTAVPFFTAIVRLDEGRVTRIDWERGCFSCSGNQCREDAICVKPDSFCTATSDEKCNLKIYVAWSGTDRDGNFMTSSGRTLGQYRRYAVGDIYDDLVSDVNSNANNF